jgi:hypothetical protein
MTVPLQRLSASQAYRQSLELAAFEACHDWPVDAEQYGTIVASGGSVSHNATLSAHVVAVSSASGSRAVLRSHARPRAAANRSWSCVVAGHCSNAGQTSQKRRWGRFDDESGLFFELDGETLYAVRRSKVSGSVVDTAIPYAQWTAAGVATGKTPLDVTYTHVYEIRSVWPNGDALFLIDGAPMHQMDTDGSIIGPAYHVSRLPVAVEVVNSGSAAIGSFVALAANVSCEGALQGKMFSAEQVDATITTEQPLVCIRPAATFSGQANFGELHLDSLSVICGGDARVRLVRGCTVTGGTWDAHANVASFAEVNDDASSISDGRAFSYLTKGELVVLELAQLVGALRRLVDDTRETFALTVESLGASISARAVLNWKEIR